MAFAGRQSNRSYYIGLVSPFETKLERLHLGENQIDSNGFRNLEHLEELILQSNKVAKIDENAFQHLNKLKLLDLERNEINRIDLSGGRFFENVKNLKLWGNPI